jgi:chemosensory pili system protein ChpA (sensor histidine kinase/response regulator)
MSEVAEHTLHVVATELGVTLGEARAALEAFAERPAERAPLEICSARLHEVHGVLRVVEVYGAALLAEEMELVSRYLMESADENRNQPESLDALMRAMVQLPAYLERVLSGGRDLALVLLPLLNDLRAVRGNALLSEGTLLLLNLTSDRQPKPMAQKPGEPPLTVAQWARRLRPRFQVGLLGWIRGERAAQQLEILAVVAERLEQVATRQPVFQLWWVVGAVIEALRGDGLEGAATVKRLLGQADRELKRLYEIGEARYSESPSLDLLNNLLYYVARSSASGPRVAAVRASFKLQELLPVSEQVEQERENLSAPSVKLMETVAAAIKEDLSRVKDVLDIFVRKGASQVDDLGGQIEMLRKISDTLGVLGLGGLRAKVQAQLQRLQDIVEKRIAPTDSLLVDIAAALISVEDNLDAQLVRMIMPNRGGNGAAQSEETDGDFQQVQKAVLRECVVNLARIKETVAAALARHEQSGADQVPDLLRGMTAGLLMLGRSRAVEVLEGIGRHLQSILAASGELAPGRLDRLADAIVSVEYYMETLQSGRSDPWYMLDNAETCLRALDAAALAAPLVSPPGTAETGIYLATQRLDREIIEDVGTERTEVLPNAPIRVPPPAPAPVFDATTLDPDLVALFIEEAREELAKISTNLPVWDRNPLDDDALTRLRRSFHTLKGSGRMVGARRIGDFSWAIENLLNRVISGTLSRTPGMLALLREAGAALPALIEQLESTSAPPVDVTQVISRANAYADGRDGEPLPLPEVAAATSPVPVIVAPAPAPAQTPAPDVAATPAVTPPDVPAMPWMISTAVLLGNDPALPAHLSAAQPATADSTLEVPSRFVRVEDHDTSRRRSDPARDPPPPPPSGSEFALPVVRPPPQTAPAQPVPELPAEAEADPVLVEIYRGEVSTHLVAIREFLATCSERFAPFPVTEALHRACHTLAGASKMAEARQGIKLSEPLNLYIRKLYDHGLGLPEAGRRALADAVAAIDDIAQHITEATGFFSTHDDILVRVNWLDADANREIAARGLAPAAPNGSDAEAPDMPAAPAAIDEDMLSSDSVFSIAPSVLAATSTTPSAPPPEPAPAAAADDFDAEIAMIFSEEATELLEAIERAFAALRRDARDTDRVTELKRFLHTLKGGARMAGVSAMGELAHEVESLLTHSEAAGTSAEARTLDLLQSCLDELNRMREAVNAGRNVGPATALIIRLREISRGATTPPVLKSVSVEQPLPQPVSEPPPSTLAPPAPPVVSDIAAAKPRPAVETVPAEPAPAPASAEVADPSETSLAPLEASLDETRSMILPPGREIVAPREDRQELARVDAELLDSLLNSAGEVSIHRSRLEQQLTSVDSNLAELARVVQRLRDQLRNLEIETEAQILHRYEDDRRRDGFDPLEMDRYSTLQQYSRALAESASDVASLQGLLESQTREAQNLLMQQARIVTDLQNGLMRTRMVPFQRHVPRLTRTVRQVALETGRRVELTVSGATGELDRQVLERMMPPFEHMLRNAVVHGIEAPARRTAAGKSETGRIEVSLRREGSEVVIVVEDDGAGLNLKAIRDKAVGLGLILPRQVLSDADAMQLILEPGFSTATSVTQSAGRGVGMDVVTNEVKRLGGALQMDSTPGRGTRFTIRLPFTLAVSQALIVRAGTELFALPLPTIESVVRLSRAEVQRYLHDDAPTFEYGGQRYRFQHIGAFVGGPPSQLPEADVPVPVILVRAGDSSTALVMDELVGSREIVVKNVGPQIAGIRGIAGATILGDGRIVIILDMGTLVRGDWRSRVLPESSLERADRRIFALVVDDSITVRRVTQRLLERNGMRVMTAKDGVDALAILEDHLPDVILLDIEMPRMDGYEVAAFVRGDARLKDVPIVMITSRVGEKHRARAIELGVNDYLGKPYQENQLLDAIEPLVQSRREGA